MITKWTFNDEIPGPESGNGQSDPIPISCTQGFIVQWKNKYMNRSFLGFELTGPTPLSTLYHEERSLFVSLSPYMHIIWNSILYS